MGDSQLGDRLAVGIVPAVPHGDDREFIAEQHGRQERGPGCSDDGNVEDRTQRADPGIAGRIDANGIVAVLLRGEADLQDGRFADRPFVGADEVAAADPYRLVVKVDVRAEVHGVMLLAAQDEVFLPDREGHDYQDFLVGPGLFGPGLFGLGLSAIRRPNLSKFWPAT